MPLARNMELCALETKAYAPKAHSRQRVFLPRLQLFEFHECSWFPSALRNGITQALRRISEYLHVDEVAAPLLRDLIEKTGCTRLVDMCSGSGGPVLRVVDRLAGEGLLVETLLTDRYPNHQAFDGLAARSDGRVKGCHASVDAMNVPAGIDGIRTMFNAFHHFSPESGRAILKDAHDKRQPIAIFEITDRTLWRTLTCFPASALVMLATAPFMDRPVQSSLFSYLVPVLPLAFGWDGLVSCLRSYSVEEFEALAAGLRDDYEWVAGCTRLPKSRIRVSHLMGCPRPYTSTKKPRGGLAAAPLAIVRIS